METNDIISILKEERVKRKITQSDVANYLGVDVSAISLFESGKRKITIELLDKWLAYFSMKLTIVDTNSKEISTIPKEDIKDFQKLKKRRNEIIHNRHIKQVELLKSIFPEKSFFATGNMPVVAMIDQVDLQTGNTSIIYYNDLVVNGSLNYLPYLEEDCNILNFRMSTITKMRFDYIELPQYKSNDEGVILYKDNDDVLIRDASGFTIDLLVKVNKTLIRYNKEINKLLEDIKNNTFETEELEMIQEKISYYINKWKISTYEYHPQFEYWSKEDFESTRYEVKPIM